MLSPEETQEFVEQQDNKWIFVDNTLIREEDLNSVNWTEADSVRVMPGLVGGSEKLIQIEVADQTGHQTLMLSPEQTQEFVEQQDDKWIFVDNMLVRESELWNVNWAEAESVRIMPGLVGGQEERNESESLLEAILTRSRKHAFPQEEDASWRDGRIDRANGLIKCFEESLDSNRKALTMLKGVLEENSDSTGVWRAVAQNLWERAVMNVTDVFQNPGAMITIYPEIADIEGINVLIAHRKVNKFQTQSN